MNTAPTPDRRPAAAGSTAEPLQCGSAGTEVEHASLGPHSPTGTDTTNFPAVRARRALHAGPPANLGEAVAAYVWLMSPVDHWRHAFTVLGELSSTAICGHTVRTSVLADVVAGDCPGCMVVIGRALVDLVGRPR